MSRRQRKFADIGTKRHALFFFLIYIAGAIILTLEKWFVSNVLSGTSIAYLGNAAIILSAIALMSIYVFFVTIVPATKLRTDVAADNVYYLGFLYTLTSLAVALSFDDPNTILANFGVAIVSTLIGIAARVGLNQLRVDPTDIEEASRLELADATRKVRAELHETVRQLTDFRNVSLQVLTEGYEEVQKNVENISSNVLKSVEDLVEQSAEPLTELVAKAKSANEEAVASIANVTKSNKALAKSNEDMVSQIEAVNSALAELSEHYGDTGIIDDKVINSVQEQLLKVQNQLTDKAKDEFSQLKSSVKEASKNTKELHSDFKKAQENKSNTVNDTSLKPSAPLGDPPKTTLRATRSANAAPQSSTTTHLGTKISFDPKGSGYFVGDKGYATMNEARAAIEKSAGMTINEARRAIKSANEDE